ncbi:MAG: hypothetical protein RL645_682 [Actinomycetota bacterium]|jgi:hypothetical protein
MANYEYKQHPHVEARRAKGPAVAHSKAHPSKGLSLNERIGLAVTRSVGTMWAAYAFFGLSLVSLPAAIGSGNTIVMVSWVAQTFLQLVLLPIIIVGQNIQAKASDQRAIATYEDAGAILEEAKEIQSHLGAQDAALDHLLVRVEKLEAGLKAQGK